MSRFKCDSLKNLYIRSTCNYFSTVEEMECTQDSIHAVGVMVLSDGREVSMVKLSVEERSRVPLNACIIVQGNEIIHCRNHLECRPGSAIKRLVLKQKIIYDLC